MHAGAHVPDLVGIHLGRYMDAYAQGRYVQVGVLTFGFMGIPIWFRGLLTQPIQSRAKAKQRQKAQLEATKSESKTRQTNRQTGFSPPLLPLFLLP